MMWSAQACCWALGLLSVAATSVAGQPASKSPSPFLINLGTYAKGDGSDETAAIQKAFDAIPAGRADNNGISNPPGGVLYIPRPPVAYAISKTIHLADRYNVTIHCESPVLGTGAWPANHYFRWIGPDNGVMFNFRSCHGVGVENLSLTGFDHAELDRLVSTYKFKPQGRHTRGVTGILFGPVGVQPGFQKFMVFNQLTVSNVACGIRFGDFADNGADLVQFTFIGTTIMYFSDTAIWANSGNLANVSFLGLTTCTFTEARSNIRVDGGELVVVNLSDSGPKFKEASIEVNAGGIHVVHAWSESNGPFLKTGSGYPEWTPGTYGSINSPMILEGVRHFEGSWMNQAGGPKKNPVPLSIIYDRQVPLHLIGCSLWGGVKLGANSQATIIDQGTVFIDKNSVGFTGEGVTRYGRVVHLGTANGKNARILDPYVVDRRNTPGTAPPKAGVWEKGDGIVNIDPDLTVPAKACRGWICVKGGEPGQWVPYGALEAKVTSVRSKQ